MENLKFALRLIWKIFSIRFYIENKEIFLITLYRKSKTHKKVIFKALLRLSFFYILYYVNNFGIKLNIYVLNIGPLYSIATWQLIFWLKYLRA